MSVSNFFHSGDLGDIIYSLPTIKELGGGNLYLGPIGKSPHPPDKKLTSQIVNDLTPILTQQEYIHNVYYEDSTNHNIHYDLNKFRNIFIDWKNNKYTADEVNKIRQINLVELTASEFNLSKILYVYKWLTCKKNIGSLCYPIIVNRTSRYNNPRFPWTDIIKDFRKNIIFLGTVDEHKDFTDQFGNITHIKTPSMTTVFELIHNAKLFIGNQSFLYSLAEGLKKPCLQETHTYMNNCMFFRKDAYITNTTSKLNYIDIKNFIIKYILQ